MALSRMQQRRGPSADWLDANTILASGEIGYETDTKKFKIGDGVTAWPSLPYFENEVDVAAAIQAAVDGILDLPPETLDTLNELAAALGDDPDFFNTVVYKSGSTMSGPLILSADPTQDLEAATKQYVDNVEPMEPGGTTGQALVKASDDNYDVTWTSIAFDLNGLSDVDTAGAVDKNTLVYEEDTNSWVAGPGGGRFTVSEIPPTDVLNGDTWLDSTTGNSYLYYEDYDNAQWIQIAGPNSVGAAGGSLTIATTAPGTPVDGDLWYDPTEGFTYIYYRDEDSLQWVQFGLNRNGAPGEPGEPGLDGDPGADGADGVGIPSGGTSGQILSKASATDYDTSWVDQTASSSIDTLSDTNISSPLDGQALVYDSGTEAWINETPATTLNALEDTAISSPTEGDVLSYNGTSWQNSALSVPESPGFTASQTITSTNNSWPIPSLGHPIAKVTVVGAGGGGGAGAGNSNTGNTGSTGGSTTVVAGVTTVSSSGGPGGTATGTSARSGFNGVAGLSAGNGGGGGSASTSGVTAVQNSSNGSGGAVSIAYVDLTGLSTLDISVGGGGAGGTTSNGAPGGNGGRGEVIIEYVAA